eukprot:1139974-Pelagomonas_calceolata.AAC.5
MSGNTDQLTPSGNKLQPDNILLKADATSRMGWTAKISGMLHLSVPQQEFLLYVLQFIEDRKHH